MPKQFRWTIKQKFDGYINHQNVTKDELVDLAALYRPHHPDYADRMMSLAFGCEKMAEALSTLRDMI